MPTAELDRASKFSQYAHPEKLVSTDWLAAHLDDPAVVVVESDEDVLLYDTGHIPNAVKIDWFTDLQDPVARDYLDGEGLAGLLSDKGIARDQTVVFYGDNFNWWAAYALWVFTLFGHPDVRLLDGGRAKWIAEGRPTTTDVPTRPRTDYPTVERDDAAIRAFADRYGPTSAAPSRWSTCGRRRSTAARSCTCPTIPRRERCAAATSPGRPTCPGSGRPTTTARSRTGPRSKPSTWKNRASAIG